MKRYLLFGFDYYYPSGGWEDFIRDFDSVEEAKEYVKEIIRNWKERSHNIDLENDMIFYYRDYYQVVDVTSGDVAIASDCNEVF